MSLSPRDMDFIGLKQMAAREIALSLGVPPLLLGVPGDNTYANYAEANRTFWRQTVIPLAGRLAVSLSRWLLVGGDVGLELRCNLDDLAVASRQGLPPLTRSRGRVPIGAKITVAAIDSIVCGEVR